MTFSGFQALLILYMAYTHTNLIRHKRGDKITFRCCCFKKNKGNAGGPCKCSITVAKLAKKNSLKVMHVCFDHNHVMFPKETYLQNLFKANFHHLKVVIKQHITDFLKNSSSEEEEPSHKIWVNNNKKPENVESNAKKRKTFPKEITASSIFDSIKKLKESYNMETNLLIQELEKKGNRQLQDKFRNMVNKIRSELIIVAS